MLRTLKTSTVPSVTQLEFSIKFFAGKEEFVRCHFLLTVTCLHNRVATKRQFDGITFAFSFFNCFVRYKTQNSFSDIRDRR